MPVANGRRPQRRRQWVAAVRRLAYEAADPGLLSAELAAGIRRLKGVKKLGVRLGNCRASDAAQFLTFCPDVGFVGVSWPTWSSGIYSNGKNTGPLWISLVPVPEWVKASLDRTSTAADLSAGRVLRYVSRAGKYRGNGVTERVVWHASEAVRGETLHDPAGSARSPPLCAKFVP